MNISIQARDLATAFLQAEPDEQLFFLSLVGREIASLSVATLAANINDLAKNGDDNAKSFVEHLADSLSAV